MRILRRIWHYLRGKQLDFVGRFNYFGTTLYFPRHSVGFLATWEQGVFESDNVRILQALAKPESWIFDVGANIGLISAPVLAAQPQIHVLAFEPSPNNIPYLSRSISESPYRERWSLVPKVAGPIVGLANLAISAPENSMFDGQRSTGRVASVGDVEVAMTTIDAEWERLGRPAVSAIKCDVEGAEMLVLSGAGNCIREARPAILLEWNAQNLALFGIELDSLLEFSEAADYHVVSVPRLARVTTKAELQIHMTFTEYFLLFPR